MRSQLQTIHIMTQVTFSRPLHRSWMNLIFCTRLIIFGAAVDGASVIQIVSSFEDANRFFKKKKNFKLMLMFIQPFCSPTSAALFLDAVLPELPFPHLNMYSIRLIFMECQTACQRSEFREMRRLGAD